MTFRLILLTFAIVNCSKDNGDIIDVRKNSAELSSSDGSDLDQRMKHGEDVDFTNISVNESLIEDSFAELNTKSSDSNAVEEVPDNPFINYEEPEGYETQFSEPQMITGANLRLSYSSMEVCNADISYSDKTPTVRSLFETAVKNKQCGPVNTYYCLRTFLSNTEEESRIYDYGKTASFTVNIPCSTIGNGHLTKPSVRNFNTTENFAKLISYSEFVASVEASELDSSPLHYRLISVESGKLYNGQGTALIKVGDLLSPQVTWRWNPDVGASGENIPAFTLKEWDGTKESTQNLAVHFDIVKNNVDADTYNHTIEAYEDTSRSISYLDLLLYVKAYGDNGSWTSFELLELKSGSLTGPDGSLIKVGDRLTSGTNWSWKAGENVFGDSISGFVVKPLNGDTPRDSDSEILFKVNAVNDAPILVGGATLAGLEDVATLVDHSELVAQTGAMDIESDAIEFEIVSLPNGTFLKSDDTPVKLGDRLGSSEVWSWQAGENENGSQIGGFSVKLWDGERYSVNTAYVSFDIAPINDAPKVGGDGVVVASEIDLTGLKLSWEKATDIESDRQTLEYCVYYSDQKIESLEAVKQANLISCSINTKDVNVSNLSPSKNYNFNVTVSDGVNQSLYSNLAAATRSAIHVAYVHDGHHDQFRYLTNISGNFSGSTINSDVGSAQGIDFKVGLDGSLHFSFYESDAKNLNYMHGSETDLTIELIPSLDNEPGKYHAFDVDESGTAHFIWTEHRSHRSLTYTSGVAGSFAAPTIIGTASPTEHVGNALDLLVDDGGNVHFVYIDGQDTPYFNYGKISSEGGTFSVLPVQPTVTPFTNSLGHIAIDGNGLVHTLFYNYDGDKDITYKNSDNLWNNPVDHVASDVDTKNGMDHVLDASGVSHVCYRDHAAKLFKYATNASGSWVSEAIHDGTVDSEGGCAIGVGSTDQTVHIVYSDTYQRNLVHVQKSSDVWTSEIIDADVHNKKLNLKLHVQ